jgi:hypothetical protein
MFLEIEFLMLPQVAEPFSITDRRGRHRIMVRSAVVTRTSRYARSFGLLDISSTGCMVATDGNLAVGEKATVELPGGQFVWCHGELAGLEFFELLSKAVLSSARLKSDHLTIGEVEGDFGPSNEHVFGQGADVPDSERLPRHQRIRIILALTSLPWLLAGVFALAVY